MTQYMTEKEILTLVSVGAVKGAQATVSVTRPGSWHLSFDLANGTSALIGTARGDLKNYTLPRLCSAGSQYRHRPFHGRASWVHVEMKSRRIARALEVTAVRGR